jgi:hypothetical protein
LLKEASDAFGYALQVYTREARPQDWAETQTNLGAALAGLADYVEGPRAVELLKEAVDAFGYALQVLTHHEYTMQRAVAQDNLANTLERLVAKAEFRACLEQLGRSMTERDFTDDPQFLSLIHLFRIMCHEASAEGGRTAEALDAFIAHIGRQTEPFRVDRDFSWLRSVVEQSDAEAIAAHRGFLLGLLDAAVGGSREDILAGLRRLRNGP